jgi:monoamine oxidase
VRSLEGFAEFPIELGAEELHGPDNSLVRRAEALGVETLRHFTTDDMLRLDGELVFLDQAEKDRDVHRAFELINGLGHYDGPAQCVQEFLVRGHFPRRAWHYLDSRLGVEHGTTLDRLSMGGFLHYERGWEARETNYTLPGRYLDLFAPWIAETPVQTNTVVESISWGGAPVVRTRDGRVFAARAVLVTVSLLVLREGGLVFDPPLPPEKTRAMQAIGMDRGMKILLKFHERFWDERMYFLHTDGFLPQYWCTGKGKSENNRVLTAFVGGSRHDALAAMGGDPVRFALEELDEIFPPRLATRAFAEGFVADWGADPFVRGLYSYPTVLTTEADRATLAASLAGRLFFAGEATDTAGHSGTVHGAMDTGTRAAQEILAALG